MSSYLDKDGLQRYHNGIKEKLAGKSDTNHTHSKDDITGPASDPKTEGPFLLANQGSNQQTYWIEKGDLLSGYLPKTAKAADADKLDGNDSTYYLNYNNLTHSPTLGTAASKNTGTSAGNIPILDSNGQLADSVIPAVAITDTYVVATEAAMLALSAQKGDIAIRSDLNKSFVLQSTPASTLANWKELLTPTDAVLSVNGKTGAVILNLDNISDGSTRKLANYLPLTGGAMTGPISYKGTNATYSMIKWINNTADEYGNGIRIGGGGATIIGGGESSDLPSVSGGDEILYLMNDGDIDFYSNCQNGLDSAKHMVLNSSGELKVPAAIYENGTSLANKYAPSYHVHTSLVSNTDNRNDNTTPNDYNAVFKISGLKLNSAIGLSNYGSYSCVLGVRGWGDSSGGNAHEIALTGDGYLMHRNGATTSWSDWKTIAYTSDIPIITLKSSGTGLSVNSTAAITSTGERTYTLDSSSAGNAAANKVVLRNTTGSIQTEKLAVSSGTTTKATMQYNSTEDCIEFIFA